MTRAALKLVAVVTLLFVMAIAISVTEHEGWRTAWFLLFIFAGLPLLILTTIDLGQQIRDVPNASWPLRALGFVLGVPQALIGLCTACAGVAIILWVLWNTFVHREPQYTGGFVTFGVGPLMVLFGAGWLWGAFSRTKVSDEQEG